MKFAFHDCVLCLALMSLFLHFASLCYVMLYCMSCLFKQMILILMSHSFDCKD